MHHIKYTARQKERALKLWFEIGLKFAWKIAREIHCHESTLWRWKAQYDGTLESLTAKSSRPHTPHPNAHTPYEWDIIRKTFAEYPDACISEIYGILRHKFAYSRSYYGFYHFVKTNDLYGVSKHNERYIPQPYDTPDMIGQKLQMDVKFVPTECLRGEALRNFKQDGTRLYQYTIIDEASRERFIYIYNEHSGWSTRDFLMRATVFYGYRIKVIQTDNGTEFTNPKGTGDGKIHICDKTLLELGIQHQLIRPYTPRHNGKVERSHRNDQARFYNKRTFTSLDDCQAQAAEYLRRSNNIPSRVLRSLDGKRSWLSPNEKRAELINLLRVRKLFRQWGSILCLPAPTNN